MTQAFNPYNNIIFLCGRKETGKTFRAKAMIREVRRKIIYDRNHEHDQGFIVYKLKDLEKAWSWDELTSIIYRPLEFTDEEFQALSSFVLRNVKNCLFFVEEVQRYATVHGYRSQAFAELVNRGRHQGVGLLVTSRRPAQIHIDIRENASLVFCFSLNEMSDIEYVAKWFGLWGRSSEEHNKAIKTIRELPRHKCFVYNGNTHKYYIQGEL